MKIDSGLLTAGFGKITPIDGRPVVTTADATQMHRFPWAHQRIFASIPNTATYFPLAYLSASIGLGVGKLLGVSPFVCIILARLGKPSVRIAARRPPGSQPANSHDFLPRRCL